MQCHLVSCVCSVQCDVSAWVLFLGISPLGDDSWIQHASISKSEFRFIPASERWGENPQRNASEILGVGTYVTVAPSIDLSSLCDAANWRAGLEVYSYIPKRIDVWFVNEQTESLSSHLCAFVLTAFSADVPFPQVFWACELSLTISGFA